MNDKNSFALQFKQFPNMQLCIRQRTRMKSSDEWWLVCNRVDAGSKRVFLSLDVETREVIRNDGTVRNCPNPSATLMARIRAHAGPGFVPDRIAIRPWKARPENTVEPQGTKL